MEMGKVETVYKQKHDDKLCTVAIVGVHENEMKQLISQFAGMRKSSKDHYSQMMSPKKMMMEILFLP